MNRRVRSLSLFAAIAVAFTVIGAVPATACLVPPPQKPDIWIDFHSPTDVWITFHGFKTFGSTDTQFCACGRAAFFVYSCSLEMPPCKRGGGFSNLASTLKTKAFRVLFSKSCVKTTLFRGLEPLSHTPLGPT